MITRRRPRTRAEAGGIEGLAINLTPLLDVLFMLLTFLVLTANAPIFGLDLSLPRVTEAQSPAPADDRVTISLYREGEAVTVGGQTFETWEQAQPFLAALLTRRPEARFVIAGDRATRLERVTRVLSFLQARGVARIRILVQPD